MTDDPPAQTRRGRPPSLLKGARAALARADLRNCRFVLGAWLESLHSRQIARIVRDLESLANDCPGEVQEPDLAVVATLFLHREHPEANGRFSAELITDALNRLHMHAQLEQLRRDGLVTLSGDRALSTVDGFDVSRREGVEEAQAAGAADAQH